ncbi:MFS transporter [Streptomyces sp. NPDC097619]|uniref:MDR family MFS transporter n=1 Tax=Streptomyces sp. NPDC097619 TaxID=3157228 RepID=UPI0033263206
MTSARAQFLAHDRAVQLLLINQFTINLGFYMLMPYLAAHLSGGLGLAGWLVGLVLGVRNFSQQGMFLIGGTLADRLGYKPLIVAGLLLRTAGFAVLGLATSVPALIAASAATGFAGALFNPAVRAYLAEAAGEERRVDAFALFNVFYQAGILLGPLVGMVLVRAGFRPTCLVAAAVFAVLGAVQLAALPARGGAHGAGERAGVLAEWRGILADPRFLLFAAAMSGSYVLTFQVYLALPLEVRRVAGEGTAGTAVTAALFVASGLATVLFQTRVTARCKARHEPRRALVRGLLLMGAAFLPPLAVAAVPVPGPGPGRWTLAAVPAVLSALLLAWGTMTAYPFEMDTIVRLAGDRLVATHYGLYNTVCGIGITLGNLVTGAALDAARGAGLPALPWAVLALLGAGCAWALRAGAGPEAGPRAGSTAPGLGRAPTAPR